MTSRKRKLFFYSITLIIIIGLSYILFNEFGLVKYIRTQHEYDSLKIQLSKLKEENKNLQNEIDSLKNNVPAKIEEVAREKYNMKRENEIILDVKEK